MTTQEKLKQIKKLLIKATKLIDKAELLKMEVEKETLELNKDKSKNKKKGR